MSDEHRINRDRRGPEPEPEQTFICEYCGREYEDREKFERHRDREKRNQLRGSELGDAILEIDNQRRTKYR